MNNNDKMDKLLKEIGKLIKEQEEKPAFLDQERMAQFAKTYGLVLEFFDGTDAKIKYEIHKPFVSMGSISVVANEIKMETQEDYDSFYNMIRLASNVSIYPRVDDRMCMDLTFHGIAYHVKEKDNED